jgi:predicted RNase H-like nuclease (RuvC/YqgF family)
VELEECRKKLEQKEQEIAEITTTFDEVKNSIEGLKAQLSSKDNLITTLQSNLTAKDDQVTIVSGLVKTKDQQIETINHSLAMKDEQIFSLKNTLEAKENEIQLLAAKVDSSKGMVSNAFLEEKNKRIQELEKEIKLLNLDLKAADEREEKLETKIKNSTAIPAKGEIVMNAVSRAQIIDFLTDMVSRSVHNLIITTPSIQDLAELGLYDARTSVNIKASCSVQPNSDDQALLQEFEALDNVSIRNFDSKDRWICLKDNAECFIVTIGEKSNAAFFSNDHLHIKFFANLLMESWLLGRKL